MKKLRRHSIDLLKNNNIRKRKKQLLESKYHKIKKSQKQKPPSFSKEKKIKKHSIELERKKFRENLYKKNKYNGDPREVNISREIGIEKRDCIDDFLKLSSNIIDFDSKEILFNLSHCTRLWPSAITLLCSLKQWVELCSVSQNMHQPPKIRSTPSNSDEVNSYLAQCGFYDYVGRAKDTESKIYDEKEIVKIERETNVFQIEKREDQILELLKKFSALTSDQLEIFNCIILTEIFNNVTEHGISNTDRGYWVLAQRHKRTKIISICIADNGIGIRNSLMTGPQKNDIKKKIKSDDPSKEGDLIKLAIEENVSGAVNAPLKTAGFLKNTYERGARRGNGLQRIKDSCKELKIKLSILSHNGYVFIDEDGKIFNCGGMGNRIFAGTFYHLNIPTN